MPDNPVTWREFPYAPFLNPMPPPEIDPHVPDLICVQFNREYLPFVIGALRTLIYPDMYEGTQEETELASMRFEKLISLFQLATTECPPCACDDDCNGDCNDCSDCEEC